MSRSDLKDLGEHLDAGQVGLSRPAQLACHHCADALWSRSKFGEPPATALGQAEADWLRSRGR